VSEKRCRRLLPFLFSPVFLVLLLIGLCYFCFGCGKEVTPVEAPVKEITTPVEAEKEVSHEEEPRQVDPLTGRRVEKVIPLIAVMVDNLGASRPQTGLADAGVVYEIEAEGLITRFMALYAGDPPANVGPVRSARPYFLHLAREWDAYYAHVGGSVEALRDIRLWGIPDLDDVRGDRGFWIDKTRKRPHNTYLNLAKALEGKQPRGRFKDWSFTEPPEGSPDYREISFSYSRDNQVTYKFSEDKKQYLRYINGIPHIDRITGEQLAVTNIVLQYAPHRFTGDSLGHIDVNLIGEGKAEFFLAGKYVEGFWEKRSSTAPTRFYDAQGREIAFVKGNTWIQVLRPGTPVHKE